MSLLKCCHGRQKRRGGVLMTPANWSRQEMLHASWTHSLWGRGVSRWCLRNRGTQKGPRALHQHAHWHHFKLICTFRLFISVSNNAVQWHSQGLPTAPRNRESNRKEWFRCTGGRKEPNTIALSLTLCFLFNKEPWKPCLMSTANLKAADYSRWLRWKPCKPNRALPLWSYHRTWRNRVCLFCFST